MAGRVKRTLVMLLAIGCALLAGCQNEDQAASSTERPDPFTPVQASTAAIGAVPSEAPAPTPTAQDGPVQLKFLEMYTSQSSSRGLRFSDAFSSMNGKAVQISGYMAPPLKPVFTFFVLAREPMAICPFCSSDAEWPSDIVLVYVEGGAESIAGDTMLTVTGRLELGSYTDPDTGFVSQARVYADKIEANR